MSNKIRIWNKIRSAYSFRDIYESEFHKDVFSFTYDNEIEPLKQRLKDAEEILSNCIEINYKEATVLESNLSKICREYFKKHGGGCDSK